MSDDKAKPALTPEEWARVDKPIGGTRTLAESVIIGIRAEAETLLRSDAGDVDQAAAALLLRGQPFGFTRDDVIDIVTAANDARQLAIAAPQLRVQAKELADRLSNLSVRIAALLPPEQSGGPETP